MFFPNVKDGEQTYVNYGRLKKRFTSNYRKPYKYPGLGAKIGRYAGRYLGRKIPFIGDGKIGADVGSMIGSAAHAAIKTITGFGDYKVSQNSLVYNRDAVPQFSGNDRCTIISHREFVGDVVGSTNFNLNTYTINPANSTLFPWLAQISENYEEHVWQGLIFQFVTTCGNSVGSTNTALGTVVMATQYNTLAQTFLNKQQMENSEFCQSSVPSASIMHPIECDPALTYNQGLFFVQNPNASSTNADPRAYNIGKFSIATQGMQASNTVGELWVTYKICLLKPKLSSNIAGGDHYKLDYANAAPGNPFGNASGISLSTSSISYSVYNTSQAMTALKVSPWTGVSNTTALFINPNYVGDLLIVYEGHGGPVNITEPTLAVFGTVSLKTSPSVGAGFVSYSKTYTSGGNMLFAFVIRCDGGYSGVIAPYITLTGGTFATPFTDLNLGVYSIPNNLVN